MIVWAHKTAILILIFLDEKINQGKQSLHHLLNPGLID